MSIWTKDGLNEFKQKVRKKEIYLVSEPDYGTVNIMDEIDEIKDILNKVVIWLADLDEMKGGKK